MCVRWLQLGQRQSALGRRLTHKFQKSQVLILLLAWFSSFVVPAQLQIQREESMFGLFMTTFRHPWLLFSFMLYNPLLYHFASTFTPVMMYHFTTTFIIGMMFQLWPSYVVGGLMGSNKVCFQSSPLSIVSYVTLDLSIHVMSLGGYLRTDCDSILVY